MGTYSLHRMDELNATHGLGPGHNRAKAKYTPIVAIRDRTDRFF
jgi:hypothetical protein